MREMMLVMKIMMINYPYTILSTTLRIHITINVVASLTTSIPIIVIISIYPIVSYPHYSFHYLLLFRLSSGM